MTGFASKSEGLQFARQLSPPKDFKVAFVTAQPCGGLCRLTLQFQVHFRIRAMSQGICDKLDEMSKRIFQSQSVDDSVFESVYSKACSLVTQVAVQRKLESTAQLVRDNGILPVRRININIKKLSKSDDELGEQGRWRRPAFSVSSMVRSWKASKTYCRSSSVVLVHLISLSYSHNACMSPS